MSSNFMDGEAERDEDDAPRKFFDSSEEEEDIDEYEKDEFLVLDDEEVDEHDPEEPMPSGISRKRKDTKRKRRSSHEDSPELAEGDLQMLEEKGIHVNRKKRLRRLRKGASDDEDFEDELRRLDDDYDDNEERDRDRRRVDDMNFDYEDEMDDFIDDGGRGRRRRAAERKGLVSSEAVRAARSLFGDADDMDHYRGNSEIMNKGDGGSDMDNAERNRFDDDENDDDDDFLAMDEDGTRRRPRRSRPRGQTEDSRATESAIRLIAATTLDDDAPMKPKILETFVDPDVPERLICHFGEDYASPGAESIKTESEWVYNYGFRQDPNCGALLYQPENVKEKIAVFLQYVHRDKLDIPFIAMYRKDYIMPELICDVGENLRGSQIPWNADPPPPPHEIRGFNSYKYDGFQPGLSIEHLRGVEPGYDDGFGDWTTLWKIMDWDKKYWDLDRRRKRVCDAAERAIDKGVPIQVCKQVKSAARVSDNDLQLSDCERYLKLAVELSTALRVFAHGEEGADDEKKMRRPSRRKNRYADYCKKGYRSLCDYFGMVPRQFADNVHAAVTFGVSVQGTYATDAEDEPLEAARRFVRAVQEENPDKELSMEKDPSRLLARARHILVKEMTAELLVVQAARTILNKEGTVTVDTYPTPLGLSEVDDAHPLRQVTYIAGKRIERLANTIEFTKIRYAVKCGYTKLSINFQEEQVHQLSEVLTKSFSSLSNSTVLSDKWNAERKLVADEVLEELKKQCRIEIYNLLADQSNETLKRRMTQAASRRLLLGPTRPNLNDGAPKTLAICVTREEDEEPDRMQVRRDIEQAAEKGQKKGTRRVAHDRVTFVVVDENGEYVSSEELFAGWLMRPYNKNPPDEVVSQLKAFIKRMKPEAIVVGLGSGGKSAIRLKDDIRFVLVEMLKSNQLEHMLTPDQLRDFQKDVSENQNMNTVYRFIDPYVTAIDEWPARVYARCKSADIGLPVDGMTLLEKRALALGRMAQEPLTIYASICSDPDVAVKLSMHNYHYHIKPSDRILTLERALIRAVCTTGVDINRLLGLPHQKPMLQFVGGLGEHKSHALLKSLEAAYSEEDKGLPSRKHLWTKDFMGRIVFMSAAAFLRVRDPELHPGGSTLKAVSHRKRVIERRSRRGRHEQVLDLFYDPMDDSRIHPEHYAVAIKIADEALRDDAGQLTIDSTESNEISVAMKVTSAVLDDPRGLRRLALDEYAEHLFKLRRGKLYETVKLIAREFHGTFADFRRPLVSPNSRAVFYMVTRASPIDFRIGSKVTATNCKLGNNMDCVLCWLPNHIRGLIDRRDFSDEPMAADDFKKLVTDGCSLGCRVLSCEWDRFRVRLTSKPTLLKNPAPIYDYVHLVNTSDDSYRPYPAQAERGGLQGPHAQNARDSDLLLNTGSSIDEVRRRPGSRSRNRAKSIVNHRLYRDINGPAAVEALRNALPGDVIIRASSYNKDSFVFSCKFAAMENADTVVPRDIFHIEFKIERNPNDPETPARLRIGSEDFDHVDEALEQFLHPIIGNMKEALDHRKFKEGGEDQLKKYVSDEKKRNPRSIPYCIGLSSKRDLHYFIAYVPGQNTPRTEYIQVVPHGYRLRDVMHNNLEALCVWFKKNMSKGIAVRRPVSRPGSVRREMPSSPFRASAAPQTGFGMLSGATRAQEPPPPPAPPMNTVPTRSPFHQPSLVATPTAPPRSPFVGFPTESGGLPAFAPRNEAPGREPDWNRAVRRDDPPPPVQNGLGTNGHAPQAPPRNPFAAPPPQRSAMLPAQDGPLHRPPPPTRNFPLHGQGPPGRDMRTHEAPFRGQDGPPMGGSRPMRRPSPLRGPMGRSHVPDNSGRGMPPVGRGMPHVGRDMPPGRGMPPGGRGMPLPGGRNFSAPGGRGRGSVRTIPAWKLKEMQEQGQGQ